MRWFLTVLALAVAQPAMAGSVKTSWPMKHFIANDSVLATYYREFVDIYSRRFTNNHAMFSEFCRRLRTSDLLSDRFSMLGIAPREVHDVLSKLEVMELTSQERHVVRGQLLTIDLALETIQGSITVNHRAEFRREVLSEIPPVISSG